MNKRSFSDIRQSLLHHGRLRLRVFDSRRRAAVFSGGTEDDALRRIYVINLDRRPDRWRRVRRELDRFQDRHGGRLSALARRFSAIDARHVDPTPDPTELIPRYTLADQLTVEPNPLLQITDETRAREITMTKQEVAVACSHIEVWKLIAHGDVPSALVLEDDVFMNRGFARDLERTWSSLQQPGTDSPDFDLLYLAFEDVGSVSPVENGTGARQLQKPGIWEASGYVLTRGGALALLEQLPAYGPIDLWLNMQFSRLRAFTASRPLIEQRIDEPSTNSYSILPVLSQVGVITREKPLVPDSKHLPGPIVAIGEPGTGVTAIATALSMLGYTCISDLEQLPLAEERSLLQGSRGRLFNAYINIGSLSAETLPHLATTHPTALFITTSRRQALPRAITDRTLVLSPDVRDKWAALTEFLAIDYPAFAYPAVHDIGQRRIQHAIADKQAHDSSDLKPDAGPWILKPSSEWKGVSIDAPPLPRSLAAHVDWVSGKTLDSDDWKLRDDTFPSNMALFTPANVSQHASHALLTLQHERTSVRALTSGAIATTASYLYGTFRAELRPPRVSGLITGLFLHRNGPRQEIDIEFLGKDTSKMLVNVFYNPGPENTKLEYGYRGTPTLIDLGFDAAESFHIYEIDWQPSLIRWAVDGEVVYERNIWDPTPIPNQPLQLNLNLWHSRSKEFAGSLDSAQLPVSTSIRSIEIYSDPRTVSNEQGGSLEAVEASR